MVAILSALAALLAVVIGLQGPGRFAEALAFTLSLYSLTIAGVLLFIRFGPRWRKNERSRRRTAVRERSPKACRKRQAFEAIAMLTPCLLFVVLVARAEVVLQEVPVFGSQFPGDIVRAWSSWLGA
jgi:steroid 5-alpha reductase family enzyme